ncbi:MAG: hypothetical protein R2700_15865 [Solirubrobacterales bacterium]
MYASEPIRQPPPTRTPDAIVAKSPTTASCGRTTCGIAATCLPTTTSVVSVTCASRTVPGPIEQLDPTDASGWISVA